ncbi:hypothetical protein M409DRAFT_25306 [Zasmidium cellare ATCC 36951]|uniref:Uncharacterized protein n=1 Tax=Zasmidium cellare ATCC 36951 TaxID=1080233 RepID=A0A6A6CFH7_ZASCE|nr:uncharacterized protein M409DRAFT_25306 [Zasmidium cellare ATCC 36951]KAF2164429.1 hypothetical protein M409DRAFT_25306 [Zasmidium cellare ATCC 36951]
MNPSRSSTTATPRPNSPTSRSCPTKDLNQIEHPAGFAMACKELYKNFISLFYSINTFTIWTTLNTVATSTKAFLKVVGPKNARTMGTLNIDIPLGACRHPRGSTKHLPTVLRDIVTRIERQPTSPLLSDSGVDVESTLASALLHFCDNELCTMLNECKTVRIKIHYSVAGAGPGTNEMSFDWHALCTSMEEEAIRLFESSQGEDGNPLEQLFHMRLVHVVLCYIRIFDDEFEFAA